VKQFLKQLLINNWQKKSIALITATIIWFLVGHSITMTKTFSNIRVKIENLPTDKTLEDLLPTGYLGRKLSVTLTGTKSIIEELRSTDLEVVLDSQGKGTIWTGEINKKNLICLNPEIDLIHSISDISHSDFLIELENLITAEIPISVIKPRGESPFGYHFLDVWPRKLTLTVSGPEDKILDWKQKGAELAFDLSAIKKEELDFLSEKYSDDEIVYYVPDSWKKIAVPFLNDSLELINDPQVESLHIDFLREEVIPLGQEIPVSLFYPIDNLEQINPVESVLSISPVLSEIHGTKVLNMPLYVKDVSQLFLETVRDQLQVVIIVEPQDSEGTLPWSVQLIHPQSLEKDYINHLQLVSKVSPNADTLPNDDEDSYLSQRFRKYMRQFKLVNELGKELNLETILKGNVIVLKDVTKEN
jgi:hypothetical protein